MPTSDSQGDRSYRLLRASAIGALACTFAGLLVMISVSYTMNCAVKEEQSFVSHTQDVLVEIEGLQIDASGLIVGTRGYVISGKEEFLEPEQVARRDIVSHISSLRCLLKDNVLQTANLERLANLASELAAFTGRVVATRRDHGYEKAAWLVNTGRGHELLKAIRAQALSMEEEEKRLLSLRKGNEQAAAERALAALILSCVMIVGAISLTAWILRAYIAERAIAEERLASLEQRFRAIFDQTFEFIGLVEPDGTLLEANKTALDFVGAKIEDVIGRPFWDTPWWSHSPEEQARMKEAARQAAAGSLVRTETSTVGADGRMLVVDFSLKPIKNDLGQVVLLIPEGRDISERKHAEEMAEAFAAEAERKNAELEEANKELESFSYSVSHDLRAPLRAINGFANSFLERYGNQVDDEGRRLLGVVVAGAGKMGQLIDDLLSFSALGRSELQLSHLNMQALVEVIFAELKSASPERALELVCNDLPAVRADRAMMKQVLLNLLGNAVKFTRGRQPGIIEVGCQRQPDQNTFYVKDNGAGFDMQYVGKLFTPFQRLHKTSEFEGTGIGLAIVQRVIQRHGGSVRAEGMIDKGTTVYFTLPSPEADPDA